MTARSHSGLKPVRIYSPKGQTGLHPRFILRIKSYGESHHSKSYPGTHISWPTLIKTPLQSAHCISNMLALICLQWDPTQPDQLPSLCPHCALRLVCSVIFCTWTHTFVPKALLWALWYKPFRLRLPIPEGTITLTRTLTCEHHSVHSALSNDGQINTVPSSITHVHIGKAFTDLHRPSNYSSSP